MEKKKKIYKISIQLHVPISRGRILQLYWCYIKRCCVRWSFVYFFLYCITQKGWIFKKCSSVLNKSVQDMIELCNGWFMKATGRHNIATLQRLYRSRNFSQRGHISSLLRDLWSREHIVFMKWNWNMVYVLTRKVWSTLMIPGHLGFIHIW